MTMTTTTTWHVGDRVRTNDNVQMTVVACHLEGTT